MEEKKLYYLGTGTEFVKNQCKEYKTLDGALKAAAKDESLVVWDEDGNIIGSLTDNVPDGALQTNPDGSVDAFDADGNKVGTVDAKSVEEMTGNTPENNAEDGQNGSKDDEQANTSPQNENAENGANGASKNNDDEQASGGDDENPEDDENHPAAGITKEQVGRFHVTVVCEGSLRLRRSASWNNSNECGRASKGQTYVGKRVFMLDGLPMLETVDGLFMSAAGIHVKMEKMG